MGTSYKDYYKILEVDRKATEAQIKSAYRKAARKHHPDLHTKDEKASAEEKFKEVNEAYTVLSDPEKRAQYDAVGTSAQNGQQWQPNPDMGGFAGRSRGQADDDGFSDFFESLFGRQMHTGSQGGFGDMRGGFRQARPRKGQDLESELELTLEEAYRGGQKSLQFTFRGICPVCEGTGSANQKACRSCGGTGSKTISKTLDVKIPAYIRDGRKIRLKGQGGEGQANGSPGDLLLTVKIQPNPHFTLTGSNLETSIKIRPEQAVLGCQTQVPTMEGEVLLTVPPMIHSGKKLRLRSKGWLAEDGKRGDELVKVIIDIPHSLGAAEKELYQRLADMKDEVHMQ